MYRIFWCLLAVLVVVLTACSAGGSPTATPTPIALLPGQASPAAAPTDPGGSVVESTSQPAKGPTAGAAPPPTEADDPGVSPTSVRPPSGQEAELDEITKRTADIRKLELKTEIKDDYLTREQLRARLTADLNEEYPPALAEQDELFLKALGLLPPDADLRKTLLDLYTEQIAGFYDPATDEMYLVSQGGELGALEELTYAHEVVHALQDQNFDLEKLIDENKENDDADLATRALVEGDATVLQYAYLIANPALLSQIREGLSGALPDSPLLDAAPPIISQTLLFSYQEGQIFASRLWREAGWAGVNAAYRRLPASTEQILHPEKYDARDEPKPVRIADLAPTLGAGWKKGIENTMGEFQTRVLLAGGDSQNGQTAETAAAGWGGDRYAMWTSGQDEVIVWRSVWDSENDASEFVAALRSYDEGRSKAIYSKQGDGATVTTGEWSARILQSGANTTYVIAPNAELANKAAAQASR